jgi:hypothetical protein
MRPIGRRRSQAATWTFTYPWSLLNLELQVVVSNSMRRKGPKKWRFLLGLSVLGFLIIASAANAACIVS